MTTIRNLDVPPLLGVAYLKMMLRSKHVRWRYYKLYRDIAQDIECLQKMDLHVGDIQSHSSFPLDGTRRLRGDVVDDAVDTADFVDDAGRGAAEELVREREVVGGHAVGRGHRAQGADKFVGTAVAHHADASDRQQHGKGLPDRIVEAGVADLLQKDRIGLAQDVELCPSDLAGDADRQTGAGERVALDKPVGQSQLAAQFAHLVLEEFAQRLDQPQFHPRRQAADIVVRFDRDRRSAERAHRLDHVRVEGALREELDIADLVRLLVEDVDEGGADRLALLLGIGDAGELFEKQT